MKIAFSGPSGSGKTTLVKYVESLGFKWLNGSSGELKTMGDKDNLYEKHKFTGNHGHAHVISQSHQNPELGKDIQRMILLRRTELIISNDQFVTDRSPLDNWIYYLLQVAPYSSDEETAIFYNKCLEAFELLTHVIIVPFMFDRVENNGSRIPNVYYQKMISELFLHYRKEFRLKCPTPHMIALRDLDLDTRKAVVKNFLIKNI